MFRFPVTMLLASLFLLLPDDAQAAVVTIEGTIKSVDATKRTITVETKTKTLELDVSRKAKVSVKGKTAKLDSLKPGQKVTISYHDGLEIVLKITSESSPDDSDSKVGEIRQFEGHTGAILTVAYSPTGKVIASGGSDRTVRIWSVEEQGEASHIELPHLVPKGAGVTMLVFSPDGKTLASGGGDGSVRFWDMTQTNPQLKASFSGGQAVILGMAFSPDGKLLATGRRMVHLWDVSHQRPVEVTTVQKMGIIWTFAFSPDSKVLAVGSSGKGGIEDGVTLLHVTTKPVKERLFVKTKTQPRSVCFSPKGNVIAFGVGGQVRVVDAGSGKLLRVFSGHGSSEVVKAVAFSPDGSHILSGGSDGTLRLWDSNTGEEVCAFDKLGSVQQVAFSPDGRQAISGTKGEGQSNAVQLWRLPPPIK